MTMFKKSLVSVLLGSAILLGSCTPLNLQQIIQFTIQICGFVPTAVTIANFFPNPITVPAEVVATAICNAVTAQIPPATHRRMAQVGATTSVTVNAGGQSFVVTGYFVR
jgi:hypothetical protein